MSTNTISLNNDTYVLTFADEFNGTSGSFFQGHGSGGIWATSYSPHLDDTRFHPVNGDSQYFVDPDDPNLPNPFTQALGTMTINASELTTAQQADADGQSYASGLMTTEMSFASEGGYVEIRAQVPDQQGFLSAFWLLPADDDWSAEIDVFEILGHDTDTLHTNLWDNGQSDEMAFAVSDLSTGFHTYGLHWTDTTITWYLDGTAIRTEANTVNEDMYLAIGLAVGSTWTGQTDATTDFSDGLVIDYVRVYEDEDSPDRNPAIQPGQSFVATDTLGGTVADDTLYGTRWDEYFTALAGDDSVHARRGNDTVDGGDGNDSLYGQKGHDVLLGGAGADHIVGGEGDDALSGGAGSDHLWGDGYGSGAGADRFVLNTDMDKEFVHGFDVADDVVDLTALGLTWADVAPLLDDQGWATVLNFGSFTGNWGDILFLIGVDETDLTAANFVNDLIV